MKRVLEATYAVLLGLWVGAQAAVGYLVAPILFVVLERTQAGTVAGQIFERLGWIGMAVTLVLFVLRLLLDRLALDQLAGRASPRWVRQALLAMILLTAIGHFGIRPWIASVRQQIQAAGGFEACDPALRLAFGRLHGASSILFLLVSLLGLALLMRLRDRR